MPDPRGSAIHSNDYYPLLRSWLPPTVAVDCELWQRLVVRERTRQRRMASFGFWEAGEQGQRDSYSH